MDINEFISEFASLFEDADPAEFSAETEFRSHESWDSLTMLSMMALFAEQYDLTVSIEDLDECKTIADLHEFVERSK